MRICFALLFAFCCSTQSQQSQQSLVLFPDNLRPPSNETPTLQAHAVGDQIYVCDGSSWILSRPDAKLFAGSGKQVGLHFAGPAWEYSDGSRVMAKPVATATPNADSIPWLLLKATDHQGEGAMKRVTSTQRLSTKGGRAPVTGCDAQHKGQEARSHYTARYLFYTGS
jgi:hypothetical protein